MKAIVYRGNEIAVKDIKRPRISSGEALLKVKAAAICGTDIRIISHGHPLIPEGTARILGHEISGVIEEVTADVKNLKPGMSVAVAPNIHCGNCAQCIKGNTHMCENYVAFGIGIDGGFAEYMRLPTNAIKQGNIIPIKEGTAYEQVALNEPLSCCYNSLTYTGFSLGETILIVGAGPIGIMHTILANKMGASKVIVSEISDGRRQEIATFGADVVIDPASQELREVVMEKTDGRGADVAVIACPITSVHNEVLECLAPGGRMNIFGGLPKDDAMTTMSANLIHYNNLKVVGTTRQSISQYVRTLRLIEGRKIDIAGLITGCFDLDEAEPAFRISRDGEGLKNVFVL